MNKFWDIEDLLISNEKLPCTAETDLKNFDFLEKHNSSISEGNKIDLPLWIIQILKPMNFISIIAPRYLSDLFYNQIQAGPVIINLKEKHVYFYDIILKIIGLLDFDPVLMNNWKRALFFCLFTRLLYLFQHSDNIQYESQNVIKNLCYKEKRFYEHLIKINRNIKFFIENYCNNNKSLDEFLENKKQQAKKKKLSSN